MILSTNTVGGPMTGPDAQSYAQRANAGLLPVLGDGEQQMAVNNLPWDGNPITKCVLLPDRTIAMCKSGHGNLEFFEDYIAQHHAENNQTL